MKQRVETVLQDGVELEELELDELFEREEEEVDDEATQLEVDPSTGLSAGWSVSVPGQEEDDPEEPPSNGWSVTAMSDSEFEPDEESGTLQTSSRALRKIINSSSAQEKVAPKDQAGIFPAQFASCLQCPLQHDCHCTPTAHTPH